MKMQRSFKVLVLGLALTGPAFSQTEEKTVEQENILDQLYTVGGDQNPQKNSLTSRFQRSLDETFDDQQNSIRNKSTQTLFAAKDLAQLGLGIALTYGQKSKAYTKRARARRALGHVIQYYTAADAAYRIFQSREGHAAEPFPIAQYALGQIGIPSVIRKSPTLVKDDGELEYLDSRTPSRIKDSEKIVISLKKFIAHHKYFEGFDKEEFLNSTDKKYALKIELEGEGTENHQLKIDEINLEIDSEGNISPENIIIPGRVLNLKALNSKIALNPDNYDGKAMDLKITLKKQDSLFGNPHFRNPFSDNHTKNDEQAELIIPLSRLVDAQFLEHSMTFDLKNNLHQVVAGMTLSLQDRELENEETVEDNAIDDSARNLQKEKAVTPLKEKDDQSSQSGVQ